MATPEKEIQTIKINVSGNSGTVSLSEGKVEKIVLKDGGPKNTPSVGVETVIRDYNGLNHKPSINGVILEGNKTSEDLHIDTDANFLFKQRSAKDVWIINHPLNKYPAVAVFDSAGNEMIGEISYPSTEQIIIKFAGAFKGTATLN